MNEFSICVATVLRYLFVYSVGFEIHCPFILRVSLVDYFATFLRNCSVFLLFGVEAVADISPEFCVCVATTP